MYDFVAYITSLDAYAVIDAILLVGIIALLVVLFAYRRNLRVLFVVIAVAVLDVLLNVLSELADHEILTVSRYIMHYTMIGVIVMCAVVYQSDLKAIFQKIGNPRGLPSFNDGLNSDDELREATAEILSACQDMAKQDVGAIIIIDSNKSINDTVLGSGTMLNAELSAALLESIFNTKAPLHDGAVIVRGNKVVAAGCFLPLTQKNINKEMGTRHRAAIGITEDTDVLSIVVSEETGIISVVERGDVAEPEKFAVVSCDQFTSQRDYWEKLAAFVGDAPSALDLIFPEVYLEDGDADDRIVRINAAMQDYLDRGVFRTLKNSFVLVKRQTAYGNTRLGIVAPVDLEEYSYVHPTEASIRATEGVVANRIPPRLKIRENAPVELPHVMLLLDDRDKRVIEPFYRKRASLEKLYDFDLNMNGGHLTGWRLDAKEVLAVFDEYARDIRGMYGVDTDFVFAVGDGNHSLATAQAHWKNVKKTLTPAQAENHPARYALVEIENLHCDGIAFEPIHRFVFGVDDADFVLYMSTVLKGESRLKMFTTNMEYTIAVNGNSAGAIAEVQDAIDAYVSAHPGASVDYIHGLEHLRSVADTSDGVAIEMPCIAKNDLFGYVVEHGNLCRKAFSMGEAEEKRYYFEAKKII